MSSTEVEVRQSHRARKALNDLQFSSNKKDAIGKTSQTFNLKVNT